MEDRKSGLPSLAVPTSREAPDVEAFLAELVAGYEANWEMNLALCEEFAAADRFSPDWVYEEAGNLQDCL